LLLLPLLLALGALRLELLGLVSEGDVGDLAALLEVNRFGDVEAVGARRGLLLLITLLVVLVALAAAGSILLLLLLILVLVDGVGGLALSLDGHLGDGERVLGEDSRRLLETLLLIIHTVEVGLLLLLLSGVHLLGLAASLGVVALQVQLDHVEDGALDVLGPGGVLWVELDALNHSIDLAELGGELELLTLLGLDLLLLEHPHRFDLLGVLDELVQVADANLLQTESGMTVGLELDLALGLDSGAGLLLGLRRRRLSVLETGADLSVVGEGVLVAGLEGLGVRVTILLLELLLLLARLLVSQGQTDEHECRHGECAVSSRHPGDC